MAAWVWLAGCCVLFVELFTRTAPLERAKQMAEIGMKATRVIRAVHVSDHRKERVLPVYARQLLTASILMFGTVLLVLSPFAVLGVIAARFGVPLLEIATSLPGVGASCLIALAYGRARSAFV